MTTSDQPPTMADHYSRAVRASSLVSKPETTHSATDVLGAHGLASKHAPLGVALLRLFVGDNRASASIVCILADKAIGKAYRLGSEIGRVECEDMARAVLAWHREGRCKACGGHGVRLIKGTTTLGNEQCRPCHGAGRIPFDTQFRPDRLHLAQWMAAEIEREQAKAGPAAMEALAPRLRL